MVSYYRAGHLAKPPTITMKTTYKNITFRSHLEASWARFFEWEKTPWEYEPRTFREGRFSYTPDFKVLDLWVEIKGDGVPMNKNIRLCPRPLLIVFGSPRVHYAVLVTAEHFRRCPSWEAAVLALGILV